MITLSLRDTGKALGTIDEADLQVLVDQLEEEFRTDTDYFVCPATIDILQENGASAGLISMLKAAVGKSDGVEIIWKKS